MPIENIEKQVREIIADKLSMDIKKIGIDSILKTELGMDSFTAVEMIFEIKDKFGIEIPQEELPNINKVSDVVEYISNKMNKR